MGCSDALRRRVSISAEPRLQWGWTAGAEESLGAGGIAALKRRLEMGTETGTNTSEEDSSHYTLPACPSPASNISRFQTSPSSCRNIMPLSRPKSRANHRYRTMSSIAVPSTLRPRCSASNAGQMPKDSNSGTSNRKRRGPSCHAQFFR